MMKSVFFRGFALVFALLSGGISANAHPHVFIDASFALRFDGQGRLMAIRIYWLYDAFYSLSMIEDAQLDHDGDCFGCGRRQHFEPVAQPPDRPDRTTSGTGFAIVLIAAMGLGLV